MNKFIYLIKSSYQSLIKSPGFTLSVSSTLGITIGILLCISTLAYVVFVKPLTYPDQERIFIVEPVISKSDGTLFGKYYSYKSITDLYKAPKQLNDFTLITHESVILESDDLHQKINAAYVTPEFSSLLSLPIQQGRFLDEEEGLNSYMPVAVLSYDFWQSKFNSNQDFSSIKLHIKGVSFKVIGVLGRSFNEPTFSMSQSYTDVWLPLDYNSVPEESRNGMFDLTVQFIALAKLPNKLSSLEAEQELSVIMSGPWQNAVESGHKFWNGMTVSTELKSLRQAMMGDLSEVISLLIIGVIGLTVICVTNIANLYMSRIIDKQKQWAIHAVVGANQKQLFKNLFVEMLVLITMASVIALLVTQLGLSLMRQHFSNFLMRVSELYINSFTLLFAVCVVVILAFIFATIGRKFVNFKALYKAISSSGKGTGAQVSPRKRQLLIISQVSVAFGLIFINVKLFSTATEVINISSAISVNNLYSIELVRSSTNTLSDEHIEQVLKDIKQEVLNKSNVENVTISTSPFSAYKGFSRIKPGIMSVVSSGGNIVFDNVIRSKTIGQEYFTMTNQQMLSGDSFTKIDVESKRKAIVVNEILANKISSNGQVIGMRLTFGEEEYPIVGIVKGITLPGKIETPMRLYFPGIDPYQHLIVKSKNNIVITRKEIVTAIRNVSKDFILFGYHSLNNQKDQLLFNHRITVYVTSLLTIITVLLTALGMYGVISYGVNMRKLEFGTRLAIGAGRKNIIAMVLKENLSTFLLGLLIGILILFIVYFSNFEYLVKVLNTGGVYEAIATILGLASLCIFSVCWPLKKILNQPVIRNL